MRSTSARARRCCRTCFLPSDWSPPRRQPPWLSSMRECACRSDGAAGCPNAFGFWLADRRFYQMSVIENEGCNPEFRITDDTRLATEPIVEFAIGLASAVLTAAAFVGILLSVGGAITIPLGGGISIPDYMVIAALVLGNRVDSDADDQPDANAPRRREERRRG